METIYDRLIERAASLEDIEESLRIVLSSGCRIWTQPDGAKLLIETRARVDQIKGRLKIEIYAKEHSPPHFHVTAADLDASFSIATGEHLRGAISSKDRDLVIWWYPRAKEKLIKYWNESRPTDCPVGPIET